MDEIVFLNGDYVRRKDARVDIEDRGFQFGDSIYEVILVHRGHLVDEEGHLARLDRSMSRMKFPGDNITKQLGGIMRRLIHENQILDGMTYIQVTRGAWARNLSPGQGGKPTSLIAYTRRLEIPGSIQAARDLSVALTADRRWGFCDIKTTALVAGVLARGLAQAEGYDDAWLFDTEKYVTEATAANAWIVTGGRVVTRPEGPEILSGITRQRVIALSRALSIPVEIRPFSIAEAMDADEAFVTSATALVTPVVRIERRDFEKAGPVSTVLFNAYLKFAASPQQEPIP